MLGQMTLGRVVTAAVIGLLATAVLLVWVIGGSRAEEVPLGIRVAQAVAGDGVELDGICFSTGHGTIAMPDADELTRQVRENGRNARLAQGREAAPTASALAERTRGELIGIDDREAYILYVEDGARRVDTFSRVESSEGDAVWFRTGTKMRTACGDD